MANSHLRITAAGWDTYSGDFGGANFTNAISDKALPRQQIDRIAALVQCSLCDEKGVMEGQAGTAARMVGMLSIPAEIGNGNTPGMRKATQADLDTDARDRAANSGKAPGQFYTKQQLTVIGEKEGIAGLRVIGDAWSVRDRQITKLIDLIINAQGAFTARTNASNARILAQREKAKNDAITQFQAREAAINEKAKLVSSAGTSNAIGPDGQNVVINATTVNIVQPVAPAPVVDAAPATTAAPAEPAAQTS